MGFNCLKATATSRREFTFYHSVPRNFWYSFYWPQKDPPLEPPSGFEHGTPGLGIQRLNHFAILRVHYFQTSSSWMSDRILNTTLPCQNFKTWLKLRFHFWHHSHFITYLTQFPRTKKKTWAFVRSLQNYLVYFSTMAFFHSLTFHTTERKSKIYPWYRPKH